MNIELIKKTVESYKELILSAERYIWAHPETGFKEVATTEYLAAEYEKLGYKLTRPSDITGFTTEIDTGREGPTLLILGELDSILCPSHPEANKETGAVHSCGHHAQSAALLGIAAALTNKELLEGLSGKIRLCAVPAEELLEIEYRQGLYDKGVIRYFGGKSEFLHRGYFDGVDLAFMVHTAKTFSSMQGSVGCIAKNIIYKGKAAHAGGSPQNGINAVYAASTGLAAANALRETFRERDLIRFHPIVTFGGSMVNAIPEEARIESYVRGKTFEAIVRENKKINRALTGAALSIGANIEIVDQPGYAPLENSKDMIEVAKDAYGLLGLEGEFHVDSGYSTGSTDMGDLSSIMPVVHPYCGGAVGQSHGNNYYIEDPVTACVTCAAWQIVMATLLLENGGERAKKIVENYTPVFSSAREFLDYQDAIRCSGDRIIYNEEEAIVKL